MHQTKQGLDLSCSCLVLINIKEDFWMAKKVLVHINLVICLLMGFVYVFLVYADSVHFDICEGKEAITVRQPSDITNEEYVDILIDVSNSLSADILFYRMDGQMRHQFFKTNIHEDFIEIYESKGSTLIMPGEFLATHQSFSDGKIFGFCISEKGTEIHHIETLKIRGDDLSSGTIYVERSQVNAFVQELSQAGIICVKDSSVDMSSTANEILYIMFLFWFFLATNVVFYSFSKSRDIAVKKSMGYSNFSICIDELRVYIKGSLLEIAFLILFIFILLSVWQDPISTALFIFVSLPIITGIFVFLQIIIALSVFIISFRCGVEQIKGKTQDQILFRCTTVFKVILQLLLVVYISIIIPIVSSAYSEYQATKALSNQVQGLATTVLGDSKDLEHAPDIYIDRIRGFYDDLYDHHGVIIADMNALLYYQDEGDVFEEHEERLPRITVNDNYLDVNDRIYDRDGHSISSEYLAEDKTNIIIPEDYDINKVLITSYLVELWNEDQINIIQYRSDSEFRVFDNQVLSVNRQGYISDVVVWVFDPVVEEKLEGEGYVFLYLTQYISNGLYFEYDQASALTPYQQIEPLMQKYMVSSFILSAPTVIERNILELNYSLNMLVAMTVLLCILIFTFIWLIIEASALFFINHAKDISVKRINGQELLDICAYSIIFKAFMLVVFAVASYAVEISMMVAIVAVVVDLNVFLFVLSRQSKKNIVSIIKGKT